MATLCREAGLVARALSGGEAVRAIRQLLNGAETTFDDWLPVGPEDSCPARETEPPELGEWPPALAPQLVVCDPVVEGNGVRIGLRRYAALDMTLGPRRERPFAELMNRMAEAGLPFRFSLFLRGGGLESPGMAFARASSEVLAFASQDSRHLRDAMRDLSGVRGEERAVVRLQASMLTWSGAGEAEEELGRRLGRMQQIAEGWGECTFTPMVGDPLEALVCSVPGFAFGGTGEPAAAPLTSALRMMPVGRPASPAPERADYLFRSEDGKPLGYSLEESGDYGFDLVYGLPGKGKSVLLGSLGLAFCLQGGRRQLPLLSIVDIGPTSSGVDIGHSRSAARASPARSGLGGAPDDGGLCGQPVRHAARVPVSAAGGARVPDQPAGVDPDADRCGGRAGRGGGDDSAADRRDLRDAGGRPAGTGPASLCRRARPRGGRGTGAALRKPAGEGALVERGRCLVRCRGDRCGCEGAAARGAGAARLRLGDPGAGSAEPGREAKYGTGHESVTAAAIPDPECADAQLAGAVLCDGVRPEPGAGGGDRPLGARATGQRGERPADGRHVPPGAPCADPGLVDGQGHADRHSGEIPGLACAAGSGGDETPKRLVFDEFHRTKAAAAVQAQVDRDAREARKQGVKFMLASQRLEDFGGLTGLASGYWVLGAGANRQESERLVKLFDLGEAAMEAVEYRLTGPGRDGAPALHIVEDESGRREQVLVNSVGSRELWALNTSPRDVSLRRRVLERLGAAATRAALARSYPSGSAKERIEAEAREMERRGLNEEMAETSVVDRLAEEAVEAWFASGKSGEESGSTGR